MCPSLYEDRFQIPATGQCWCKNVFMWNKFAMMIGFQRMSFKVATDIWRDISLHFKNVNTLRWRQNGCYFQVHFLEWKCMNSINVSLKFISKCPINNIPVLVHIMAWHRPSNKPISEPMMIILMPHACVTQPQWVMIWNTMSLVR